MGLESAQKQNDDYRLHVEKLMDELQKKKPDSGSVEEHMSALGLKFSPDPVECLHRVYAAMELPG